MSEKYALVDAECATLAGDEACAPSVAQACEWLEVSKSGYYEWRSRPQSAASMLALYGVNDRDTVEGLVVAARSSRGQPWWHRYRDIVSLQFAQYLGLEGAASSFRIFSPLLVPGLLHTEEYATALHSAFSDPGRSQRIIEFKMERQERLFSNPDLKFEFIVNEEALHRWIGGPNVMRRQLQHLLEAGESAKVSIQVISFTAGAHPGLGGPFVMTHSNDTGEDVLFLESVSGDQLIRDDPETVALYGSHFNQLGELSLARKQGIDLLKELIDRLVDANETTDD